jgi:hypothetical protein
MSVMVLRRDCGSHVRVSVTDALRSLADADCPGGAVAIRTETMGLYNFIANRVVSLS